jgi:2-oxoisovalerate dehydrogenase E1 component alpha subunit
MALPKTERRTRRATVHTLDRKGHSISHDGLTDHRRAGLSDEEARAIFRDMLLAREMDERLWRLNRQGKIPLAMPARGQEGAQVGMAWALDPAKDWIFPHYRDLIVCHHFGVPIEGFFLMFYGRASDPFSGGRQLPCHYSSPAHHIGPMAAPIGTKIPQSVGFAYALRMRGETDFVVATSFGEGGASKGDFYEGASLAALHRLPVLFICENNRYAISVPAERQMPVTVAERAAAFGMPGVAVDGNDPFAVYAAVRQARERAVRGDGPILLELQTYRLRPHTSDDDDRAYRDRDEVAAMEARDPLHRTRAYLRGRGLLSEADEEAMRAAIVAAVTEAAARAEAAPNPDPATMHDHLYAAPPARWAPGQEVA